MELEKLLSLLQRYGVTKYKCAEYELEFESSAYESEGDFEVDWSGAQIDLPEETN